MAKQPSPAFAAWVRGSLLGTPEKPRQSQLSAANAAATDATDEPPWNLTPAAHILLPAAIGAISIVVIEFSLHSKFIATIWPANGIILAALLRYVRSPSNYASIIVGGSAAVALAGLVAHNSLALTAILLIANVIEFVIALTLLSIFQIGATALTSFRGVLLFIIIAGGVAPIPGTLISAVAFGSEYGLPWLGVLRAWYPGHALGMLIVTPFLISVTSREWRTLRINDRPAEAMVILACFIAIAIGTLYVRSVIFVVAPLILVATMRFGLIGATASTLLIAIIADVFVVLGIGPPIFPQVEPSQRIFALQMFLTITAFWSLPTAALLTERDRLLADLSRANSQLEADSERKSHLVTGLRRHLSMAEENERLRLSHELHDQAGQSLIAAILELNEIDSLTSGPAHERLHLMRKRMEEMGKTLHRIAWELRPPSIHELGLRKALASYIAEWSEQSGTEADFHCDDPKLDEVPDEIATAVYRIVQEGLTNIIKHAEHPADVSVVIRRPDATLQLIIEDNGCGFEVGAPGAKSGKRRGLGLEGMRERLSLIGGTLEVESAVGAGTTIFARIALDGQKPAS
jgi:signal transduction histidine kinase